MKLLLCGMALAMFGQAAAASLTILPSMTIRGISEDGTTIVGTTPGGVACKWTAAGGLVTLPGGAKSTAVAANVDGTVIVGTEPLSDGNTAFIWTNGGVTLVPRDANTGAHVAAVGVTGDGSTLLAQCDSGGFTRKAGVNTFLAKFVNVAPHDPSTPTHDVPIAGVPLGISRSGKQIYGYFNDFYWWGIYQDETYGGYTSAIAWDQTGKIIRTNRGWTHQGAIGGWTDTTIYQTGASSDDGSTLLSSGYYYCCEYEINDRSYCARFPRIRP